MNELLALLRRLTLPAPAGVLATLVTVSGSSYRRPGARLLLPADGQPLGSISGGCLEADVLARARRVAETGTPELVTYDTTSENDLIWGVGLGCHGVVQVLLEKLPPSPAWAKALSANLHARQPTELSVIWRADEPKRLGTHLSSDVVATQPADTAVFRDWINPPPALAIFGAGDDAQPLVRLAKDLGWHVTVADPRAEFATAERFPTADALAVAPAAELVSHVYGSTHQAGANAEDVAVVMTHHYVHDAPIIRDLLPRPLAYVGLLGPRQRSQRILADLSRTGPVLTDEQRSRFHAPVGLDIGADNPMEIAVSIVAEIRAALAGRDGRPLRERTRPIHE